MTATTTPVSTPTLGRSVDDSVRHVLATGTRPNRPSVLSTCFTFGWRALLKIKHVPQQLFDVTMFPILFTLLFTYLFGGALAGSPREYLQFFLPGIAVQTVVFITMYTGVALNTDVSKGIFDRFRSLPIWRPSVVVGAMLGDLVRYTIAATIVIGLGVALGFRPDGGVVGVLAALVLLLLFAVSVSWIWTIFGLKLRTPESVMQMSITVLFPLVFATNIFVEPKTMPGWLQSVVEYNPVSLIVTAVRGLMHGNATAGEVGAALLVCVVIFAIFAPITMWLYKNKE
jgi:ABC-2 type transport system permease protein